MQRVVNRSSLGGTIKGVANASDPSQAPLTIEEATGRLPFIGFNDFDLPFHSDSSRQTRPVQTACARIIAVQGSENSTEIYTGSDTQDMVVQKTALVGNEIIRFATDFIASMDDPEDNPTDVFDNAIAGTFHAAFSRRSGVYANRDRGKIITPRHDAHGTDVQWHARKTTNAKAFFERVDLEWLLDQSHLDQAEGYFPTPPTYEISDQVRFMLSQYRRDSDKIRFLEDLIIESPQRDDGTLDFADQLPTGNRGMLPMVRLGFSSQTLRRLKEWIKGDLSGKFWFPGQAEPPIAGISKIIKSIVAEEELKPYQQGQRGGTLINVHGRRFVGEAIPYFAICEMIRRSNDLGEAHTHWDKALRDLSLTLGLGSNKKPVKREIQSEPLNPFEPSDSRYEFWEMRPEILGKPKRNADPNLIGRYDLPERVVAFWKRYSNVLNDDMDHEGIESIEAGYTDPDRKLARYRFLEEHGGAHLLPSAVIIQGTGSAGLRMPEPDFDLETFDTDWYRPLLEYFKDREIPVILRASANGEATSFKYGPGKEILEDDLAFFGGTMDANLIGPRLELMNSRPNKDFLNDLISALNPYETEGWNLEERLEDPRTRESMTRNILRQLLSGNHYRKHDPKEEMSDRHRIEQLYGIETRADLLASMHAKKAILAAYLHETHRLGITLDGEQGYKVDKVLAKHMR